MSDSEIGFTCTICNETQPIQGIHNWGREITFPVCDNCKSDLKEIILTKRRKMKQFKEVFTNSRLGIGVAIGTSVGYLVGGGESGGAIGLILVVSLIIIIGENMFFAKK